MSATLLTSDASLPPPFIYISGIANFRDLGGHAVASSPTTQSIRQNFIYRCGDPTRVSPEGIKTMQELGIKNVYDLRSYSEIQSSQKDGGQGFAEWEGCERSFVPVFYKRALDPESLAIRYGNYASGGPEVNDNTQHKNDAEEQFLQNFSTQGFGKAYSDILEKGAEDAYRKILKHIANEPEKPLIVHCTAGKDRTGVLCALLLSLCGVDDETVAKEYELTETGLKSMIPQILAHLKDHPALKGNEQGLLNMLSAKKENMLRTLEMIREKYGGPEGYMIGACGLSKEDVDNIRKNLIREQPAVHKL